MSEYNRAQGSNSTPSAPVAPAPGAQNPPISPLPGVNVPTPPIAPPPGPQNPPIPPLSKPENQPVTLPSFPHLEGKPVVPSVPMYPAMGPIIPWPIVISTVKYPTPTNNSFIKFFNSVPGISSIDVYLDGLLVAPQLGYMGQSGYTIVSPPGYHNIAIYQGNTKGNPLYTTNLKLDRNIVYTAAVTGTPSNIWIQLAQTPRMDMPKDMTIIRFAQLSPNAPSLDVCYNNGKRLFQCVTYGTITPYVGMKPGTYSFETHPCNSEVVMRSIKGVRIYDGAYTLYAQGYVDGNPPFEFKLVKE